MFTCNFNDHTGTATLYDDYVEPTFPVLQGGRFSGH